MSPSIPSPETTSRLFLVPRVHNHCGIFDATTGQQIRRPQVRSGVRSHYDVYDAVEGECLLTQVEDLTIQPKDQRVASGVAGSHAFPCESVACGSQACESVACGSHACKPVACGSHACKSVAAYSALSNFDADRIQQKRTPAKKFTKRELGCLLGCCCLSQLPLARIERDGG